MNSAPLSFLLRTQTTPGPVRRPVRTHIPPPEVNAARAFARLAGIDLEAVGIGGRPDPVASTWAPPTPSQPKPLIAAPIAWVRRSCKAAWQAVRETFRRLVRC